MVTLIMLLSSELTTSSHNHSKSGLFYSFFYTACQDYEQVVHCSRSKAGRALNYVPVGPCSAEFSSNSY